MATHTQESTFRSFSTEQAATYAATRGSAYPQPLYQAIFDYHQGERKAVLDVGTGPGNALRALLHYLDYGIGCDASVGMIDQAQKDAEKNGFAERTTFVVAGAEDCAKAVSGTASR